MSGKEKKRGDDPRRGRGSRGPDGPEVLPDDDDVPAQRPAASRDAGSAAEEKKRRERKGAGRTKKPGLIARDDSDAPPPAPPTAAIPRDAQTAAEERKEKEGRGKPKLVARDDSAQNPPLPPSLLTTDSWPDAPRPSDARAAAEERKRREGRGKPKLVAREDSARQPPAPPQLAVLAADSGGPSSRNKKPRGGDGTTVRPPPPPPPPVVAPAAHEVGPSASRERPQVHIHEVEAQLSDAPPLFHEVEARPVQEVEATLIQRQPSLPIYNAIPMEEPTPWYKRKLAWAFVGLLVVSGILAGTVYSEMKNEEDTSTSSSGNLNSPGGEATPAPGSGEGEGPAEEIEIAGSPPTSKDSAPESPAEGSANGGDEAGVAPVRPVSTVQGLMWLDANENGLFEPAEEGPMANVIALLRDCEGDGSKTLLATTNATGHYGFAAGEGEYYVDFFKPNPVEKYGFTRPGAGGDVDSDAVALSDLTGRTECFNATEGSSAVVNAGFVLKRVEGPVATPAVTSFGPEIMAQPEMGQPEMGQPEMGQPEMGQPEMGQPVMGQPDMGFTGFAGPLLASSPPTPSPLRMIRGVMWIDENKNGLFDNGEEPVVGGFVNLRDCDDGKKRGAWRSINTTDASGRYEFPNAEGGRGYVAEFYRPEPVSEFEFTKANAGGEDGVAVDSDVVLFAGYTGRTGCFDAGGSGPVNAGFAVRPTPPPTPFPTPRPTPRPTSFSTTYSTSYSSTSSTSLWTPPPVAPVGGIGGSIIFKPTNVVIGHRPSPTNIIIGGGPSLSNVVVQPPFPVAPAVQAPTPPVEVPPDALPIVVTPSPTPGPREAAAMVQEPEPIFVYPPLFPADAAYFTGFEGENLADEDGWSASGDGAWALSEERANSGYRSVRSPDLSDGGTTPRTSALTFAYGDPSFGGGTLFVSVAGEPELPVDGLAYSVDGADMGYVAVQRDFEELEIPLGPGRHEVKFEYRYNPLGLPALPPASPDHTGAVYVDDAYVVPSPPVEPVAQTGGFVETWDSGGFAANPWVLSLDTAWEVTDAAPIGGSGNAATVASDHIEGPSGSSELSVDVSAERGGVLTFDLLPSVEGPFELFHVLVDDATSLTYSTPAGGWSEQRVDVATGARTVTFQLLKNPGEIPEDILAGFEPSADREGRVYLGDVAFVPA